MFDEFLQTLRKTRDRNRKDYEFLAGLTGQTVAKVEADVCAPDPGGDNNERENDDEMVR